MTGIIKAIKECTGVKCVSFDIYDTILFRFANRPTRIFEYMFEEGRELFPDYIDHEDWRYLRAAAESFAVQEKIKQHKTSVVDLDEIYARMPDIIKNADKIKALEIFCEKKYSFLNPDFNEMLEILVNNYDVILVSDMYLGEKIIKEILIKNGLKVNLLKKIYVSSDYGLSKRNGKLYSLVLSDMGLKGNEVFHVGDNFLCDIKMAKRNGINTYFYDVIAGAAQRYPFLELEYLKYGEICSEIYSIRNTAAANHNYVGNEKKWFELGAMVLGPVFTGFAEWVLNTAEKENIFRIFPIMREGKFLTELLRNASEFRETSFEIIPLYTSRKALYQSIRNIIEQRDVDIIMNSDLMTINDVVSMMNISSELPEEYEPYRNILIREIRKNDITKYNEFYDWIMSAESIKKIRQFNADADHKMIKYLKQLGFDKSYITLDVGWRGSVPDGIQRMLNNRGLFPKNINLMMFGRLDAMPNIFDNCDIRGYIGSFGRNLSLIREIFVRVFEYFVICTTGTTIGYYDEDGMIKPQLQNIDYGDSNQFASIRKLQEGILKYQRLYLETKQMHPVVSVAEGKSTESCQLMARMLTAPLKEEAYLLGRMRFDQNLGINSVRDIISKDVFYCFERAELDVFFRGEYAREVEWLSGMNVLKDPFFAYDIMYKLKNMYSEWKIMLLARKVRSKVLDIKENVVIVGAGGDGRKLLKMLKVAGMEKKVECFFDNDKDLQGLDLYGKKIRAFGEAKRTNVFVIGTLNKKLQIELKKCLQLYYGHKFTCISFDKLEEE